MNIPNGKLSDTKLKLLDKLLEEEGLIANKQQIKRRDNEQYAPLSFAQERFWFIHQLEPNKPIFNMPASVHLKGKLDTQILQTSINKVVNRHESLRTVFRNIGSDVVQEILPKIFVGLDIVDLQDVSSQEQELTVKQLEFEFGQKLFSLENGPLIRIKLIQLDSEDHILLITLHHLVFDGWSLGLFLQELANLYKSHLKGTSEESNFELTNEIIHYGDFALWQREELQGDKIEQLLSYWNNHLKDAPTIVELPTNKKRPSIQKFIGKTKTFKLSNDLAEQLISISKKSNTTLFMVLMSALYTLIYRYTGQKKIVIGTPIANRNKLELETMIGLVMNTIPLYVDFTQVNNFTELLAKVKKVMLGAYEHQDIPFEKLVENLNLERDLSRHPIFQIMFVLQNSPVPSLELPDLKMTVNETDPGISKFDLTIRANQEEDGILVSWAYDKEIFEENMMNRMIEHFQTLLQEIVNHPEYRLAEFSILTKEDQHQLLNDWNNTYENIPADNGIHRLFEKQAAKQGDHLAVISDEITLSYQELNQRANQVAYYLQSQGIGSETRVGVCMERSADLIVCLLGVLKAGGAYVPIEPNMPTDRIAYILEDSNTSILLTGKWGEEYISSGNWKRVLYDPAIFQQYPETNIMSNVNQDNTAYIIYTSGSTGTPKGVIEAHRPVINLIDWVTKKYQVGTTDRVLWITSIGFDLSVYDIFGLLAVGGSIRIASQEDIGNPERLIHLLDKEKITFWDSAPAALQQLAPLLKIKENPLENTKLRLIFLSGDWIPLDLPKVMKQYVPKVEVIGLGGATEATIWSNYYEINDIPEEWTSIPYGKPIQNARYYVLDQNKNLCPVGIPGELYIAGECLAEGYVSQTLTKERFLLDPFAGEENEKMYHTGDLARYWEDGNIEFLGRIDHQVKLRGYRIELGEIETIINKHRNIENNVVTLWREKNRLIAYIVMIEQDDETVQEITKLLLKKLPEYMIPNDFIILNKIPITPNGKVDRKALPEPEIKQSEKHEYKGPVTPIEKVLVGIWKEVLNHEQIGINDNFFEVGGDSILAIRVIAKAKEQGVDFSPKDIFEQRTIANLATVVQQIEIQKQEQGMVEGEIPLLPIQHWFFEQELAHPNHFNQSLFLKAKKKVDVVNLEKAVQFLVEYHDALRLRFSKKEENWVQINHGLTENLYDFATIDLSKEPEIQRISEMKKRAAAAQHKLNIENGPLVNVIHINLGEEESDRVLIIIHHLAVDGVSWRVLIEDLQVVYQQLLNKEKVVLPSKTTSLKKWSENLVEYAQSKAMQNEEVYWGNVQKAETVQLPLDFEGENFVSSSNTLSAQLSLEETENLIKEVPKAYHTQVHEILLTALKETFNEWLGDASLLIDMEGHGREPIHEALDTSRTVGWFTSIYPIHFDLSTLPSLGESIKSVKEQIRNIPNNGIGYGIYRYLKKKAQAENKAEVSFNYLGQFDESLTVGPHFELSYESVGMEKNEADQRQYIIEVSGKIIDRTLQIDWNYSANLHEEITIIKLMEGYMSKLRKVIVHCLDPATGGYTPSDFPQAGLSQRELTKLISKVTKKGAFL